MSSRAAAFGVPREWLEGVWVTESRGEMLKVEEVGVGLGQLLPGARKSQLHEQASWTRPYEVGQSTPVHADDGVCAGEEADCFFRV